MGASVVRQFGWVVESGAFLHSAIQSQLNVSVSSKCCTSTRQNLSRTVFGTSSCTINNDKYYYSIGRGRRSIGMTRKELVSTPQLESFSNDSTSKKPIKGLLLDVDGTLCDTDDLHFEVYREMLTELDFLEDGQPISRDFFNKHICGGANEMILKRLFPHWNANERDEFAIKKEARWRERANGTLKPISGLIEFTEWAENRGLLRCAVTNAPRENAEKILQEINVFDWFGPSRIVLGSECERAKPFPDPYQIGAARLGLHPEECLAVEDSESGLRAAVAAKVGYIVGMATSLPEQTLRNAGAMHVINDWNHAELYQLFQETK
uniref:Riboflavin kinase n=1 Tax=Timspurckia oligopyrenoides TaxID=708627 RepID=A0A7S1ESQ3_9RHOD|mmetsp:Transcript_4724/g.8239  ORF Transcript_4724/g.8239 Transcript_4724/m.8239 type:complete len:322 (+) Transcript_4724:1447-2412(+)